MDPPTKPSPNSTASSHQHQQSFLTPCISTASAATITPQSKSIRRDSPTSSRTPKSCSSATKSGTKSINRSVNKYSATKSSSEVPSTKAVVSGKETPSDLMLYEDIIIEEEVHVSPSPVRESPVPSPNFAYDSS